MERKLIDALRVQVDSGIVLPEEEAQILGNIRFNVIANRTDVDEMKEWVCKCLDCFQKYARFFELPTNNPVAFFSKALEVEKSLSPDNLSDFQELLCEALAGRGFVFGTTFDLERNVSVHACDLPLVEKLYKIEKSTDEKEAIEYAKKLIYISALLSHAELPGAAYFKEDYQIAGQILRSISKQNQLVCDWKMNQKLEKSEIAVSLTVRDILEFWEIFQQYSMDQLEYTVDVRPSTLDALGGTEPQLTVADQATKKRVKKDLDDLKQTLILLLRLHSYDNRLQQLLTIKDSEEFLRRKRIWCNNYMVFLRRGITAMAIEAAVRIATTSKEAPQCFDGLNAFIKATKNGSIPKDIASKYPLFDVKNAKQHLTRDEKKIIQGYQKHPMYRCFQKITAELSKPYIAQIAPYYIAHWFIHKQDPKNPFKKQKYELNPSNTSVNDNLTVTEDERVFYYQDCHYALYKRLSQYVEGRHPEWLTDRNLSDAFYVRCRSLVVKSGWLPIESRPIYKRWMPDDLMYQLYQKLDGLFDYTRFPTYANTFCRPEDMFYFLYEKQDTKIVRVKKIIKKLISESDVVKYTEKAFLSENGIGRSIMPLNWHEELAEWLEEIIRRDDTVQAYVRGNPDPCLPGSNVKLSEFRKVWRPANEWTSEERQEVLQGALPGTVVDTHIDQQIYSEDLQPYLSVVEWYIQKVCYEKIAEDMRPKIFGLYKRIFMR